MLARAVWTSLTMSQKPGKKYEAAAKQVEPKPYQLAEAVTLVQKIKFTKFDETVEVHMRLGVDPKHADQMVRGTVVLPHGLGKSKTVAVIASGDNIKNAELAGAEFKVRNPNAKSSCGCGVSFSI